MLCLFYRSSAWDIASVYCLGFWEALDKVEDVGDGTVGSQNVNLSIFIKNSFSGKELAFLKANFTLLLIPWSQFT